MLPGWSGKDDLLGNPFEPWRPRHNHDRLAAAFAFIEVLLGILSLQQVGVGIFSKICIVGSVF